MNIDNVESEARKFFDDKTKSMNHFAKTLICVTVVLALLVFLALFFGWRTSFTNISHVVELFQGVLVCSTALMGLSGLMIIEVKKTNVSGLSSHNMSKEINAINTIASLGAAFVSLRWVLLLSLACSMLCIGQLIINNPFLIVFALAVFLDQIYLFVWGLVFLDLLPS